MDIALAGCRSDTKILSLLGTDDRIEVAPRHLGAFFYETRTRDKVGASMMRAGSTPGFGRDIVPSWMVAEASQYSKLEHQRTERVELKIKRRNQRQDLKKTKGEGKGKDYD